MPMPLAEPPPPDSPEAAPPSWWRREAWLTVALVAAAVAGAVAHARYLSVPLVDDAAISVAYASSLAAGHGLRLTAASQVVEGFSNPLWTFFLALARPLGLDPMRFASVAGAFFATAALPVYALWGAAARGRPRVEDAAGPLLIAATTTYIYWGSSGMETGLQSFLLAAAGALTLRALRRGRGTLAGLAFGLLCLTRPEGTLYVAAAAAFWIAARWPERRWPGRQEAGLALWVVALAGGYLCFRRLYFADWLPNTYYAKGHIDFHVGAYIRGFVEAYGALVVAGGAGALVAAGTRGPSRTQGVLAFALSTAGVAFVVRARGDWMGEWRFFAPIAPCWAGCLGAGLSALRDRAAAASTPRRLRATLPWALGLLAVIPTGCSAWTARARSAALRRDPILPTAGVSQAAMQLLPELNALGLVRPRLAFPDVGGLALTLHGAEVIDTGLLADYALARWEDGWAGGGGRPEAGADYLENEVLPDFVDIRGPSGFLRGDAYALLRRRYVPLVQLAPGLKVSPSIFVLAGLTRDDDPRCPGGRAAVRTLSPSELGAAIDGQIDARDPVKGLALWRCAWAWERDAALPDLTWRERAAAHAEARSDEEAGRGELRTATRYEALATVLSGGDPRRRHRTEELRGRMLSPAQ